MSLIITIFFCFIFSLSTSHFPLRSPQDSKSPRNIPLHSKQKCRLDNPKPILQSPLLFSLSCHPPTHTSALLSQYTLSQCTCLFPLQVVQYDPHCLAR